MCVWVTVGGVYSWLTLLTFPLSIRFILISAEYQFTWRSQNHDLEAVSFRVTCYLSLQWSSVFNFMWPQVRNTANQFVGQDLMVWLLECFLKYKTIEKKKFVVIWRHWIDLDFERISILRKKPTKLQKSNPIQSAISHTSFNLPSRYTFPMFNEGILKTNINNWIDDLFKIHIIYGVFPIIDSNIDHKLTGKERNSYKRPIKRNAYCKHSQKKQRTQNEQYSLYFVVCFLCFFLRSIMAIHAIRIAKRCWEELKNQCKRTSLKCIQKWFPITFGDWWAKQFARTATHRYSILLWFCWLFHLLLFHSLRSVHATFVQHLIIYRSKVYSVSGFENVCFFLSNVCLLADSVFGFLHSFNIDFMSFSG